MLRMTMRKCPRRAVDYYFGKLAQVEMLRMVFKPQWGGALPQALGLVGEATKEDFEKLCFNIDLATDERLTLRTKSNRRVGWDININPPTPESVSTCRVATDPGGDLPPFSVPVPMRVG